MTGPDSRYAVEDQRLMAQAKNYFAWQYSLVSRDLGRRVVEIGCGIGNFTGRLLDGHTVMALDVESECVARLQSHYAAASNLRASTCDWSAADWHEHSLPSLTAFHADCCVCLNVLEHLEDDREALRRMASILPHGGAIVLLVPAFPSLYGPIDDRLGHCRRYTRKGLRQLAEGVGLTVKSARYMNAIGFFGWWVNAHVLRRERQSSGQIRFFDRYIVPLSRWLEGRIAPAFGQSLLLVLTK